jgi:hypothetical protein
VLTQLLHYSIVPSTAKVSKVQPRISPECSLGQILCSRLGATNFFASSNDCYIILRKNVLAPSSRCLTDHIMPEQEKWDFTKLHMNVIYVLELSLSKWYSTCLTYNVNFWIGYDKINFISIAVTWRQNVMVNKKPAYALILHFIDTRHFPTCFDTLKCYHQGINHDPAEISAQLCRNWRWTEAVYYSMWRDEQDIT